MKRAAFALVMFVALPLAAADVKWADAYNKGVEAVRAKNYAAGADLLQKAIADVPVENGALRARNDIITYVPHFWLGIAKFNLGDVDAALREWKTSEDQGVVQSTQYYASLREWVARGQSQKQKNAEAAAAESRNAASSAVTSAVRAQTDAVAAGADRTDGYRAAQRKLQEAMEQFRGAGTDSRAFQHAAQTASAARDMFASAAEEAKKQRAARPVQIAKQTPPPVVVQQPVATPQPQPQPVAPAPQQQQAKPATVPVLPPAVTATVTEAPKPQPAAAAPVESEALVEARLALQKYRRRLIESGGATAAQMKEARGFEKQLATGANDATIRGVAARVAANEKVLATKPVAVKASVIAVAQADNPLELAYRAYAAGDLGHADQMLSQIVAQQRSAEALLLRGCTRYTRAMLSRRADLSAATADLRAALELNRALRLDPKVFSPKLVAYFDGLKH